MKKTLKTLLLISLSLASCNEDWLDYSPIDMYSAPIDIDDSDAPSFLNVAAACIQPSRDDRQATLRDMESLVLKIKAEQPEVAVIVFPELALQWYWTDEAQEEYQRGMAETVPGAATVFMARVAQENQVVVLFGLTELDPADDKLYNTQVLLRPDGELVKYRKRNLNDADLENGITPGQNGLVTVTIDQAECAMFICSDMQSESITREMAESDVDVILHSLTSTTDFNADISYLGLQMNKWVVFSNRFGDEGLSDYTGFIQIISPNGTVSRRAEGKDVYVYRSIGIYP